MLNSKQRATLKRFAGRMDAIFQVGKGGISENMCDAISAALEARELIKISVLDNSSEDVKEAAHDIAAITGAEVVAVIGRKIILFRRAEKAENRKISLEI